LAYNVNNPSAVAISGSGLGVTATGTNGCWATGGIVIDNSNGLTGASQIYFVNLNGENIQTSTTCSTATANVMNATQASQTSP
jgi:hypothetical protein